MRELTFSEIQSTSGAVRPSDWIWMGTLGATIGTLYSGVTSFSNNPINPYKAIFTGTAFGMGFHALHDVLKEYGL